jgi:PAS domain S-box-containing protein
MTAGALLLLLGAVAWFQWHERQQAVDAASSLSIRRAARLADDLTQALAVAKVAIAQTEARLQKLPAGASVAAVMGEAAAQRAQLFAALPLPFELHALDASGRAIDLADPTPASRLDRHGHTHSPPRPDPTSTVWMADLTRGVAGSRVLPMWRAAAPNAHGIAAFSVDLDHDALVARLEGSRAPQGGGTALFRIEPDGSTSVLARAPHDEAELGRRVQGPLAQALARAPRGHFEAVTQLDQMRRITAYHRLEGDAAALVIVYAMATDAVLAEWAGQLPVFTSVALLLAMGFVWGGWRLDQSVQRLERERKALERSENHFRALAGNLPDVVVRLDPQGRHLYANAAVERATGLPASTFLGKTNAELGMPADNVAVWMASLRRLFEGGRSERLEFTYPGPEGPRQWESVLALEPLAPGEAPTALVISRDITERKQREAEVKRLHATLDALVEGSSDAIFVKDLQGRYIVANRAMAALLDRPVGNIRGRDDHALFTADLAARFRADDQRVMQSRSTETYEEPVATVQGLRSHLTTKGALLIDGEVSGVFGISRDVTERQQALDALRERERQLLLAQRLAKLGHWELDLSTGVLLWSDEIFRIFEIDPQRFDATYESFLELIHPDDRDAVDAAYTQSLATRRPYGITHRLRFPDGRIKHVHEQCESFYGEHGRALRSVGTVQDVTERVIAEQALRDSEARHRELFEANPHAMWVYDLETLAFLDVNDAAVKQYGYGKDEFLRMTIKDIRPAEDVGRLLKNVSRVTEGLDDAGLWRHITKDGRLIDVEITSHVLAFQGRRAELVLAHDVTRRTHSEQALRDSEERLRLALQAANQGLYDLDVRTGKTVVSPEYARMLGYEPEEFEETNAAWRERLHPDDRAVVYQAYEDYIAGRVSEYRVEFRQRTKDGQWKWILSLGKVQERSADGLPLRMLGTHTDITAMRQAQAALHASETRLNHLLLSSPAVIYTAAASGDFGATYYSPNLQSMLGWEPERFVTDPGFWLGHVHADDREAVLAQLETLNTQGEVVLEYRFQHADGSWRWMRDAVRQVLADDGTPTELVGSWIDITARRQAEDEVRRLAVDLEQRVRMRTAELARSEARYRTIFETVPVSIGEEDWSAVQHLLRELRARGVIDGPAYFAAHPDFVQQCLSAVRVVRLNRKALNLHDAHGKQSELRDLQAFYPTPQDLPQFVGELEALWHGQRVHTAKKSLPSLTGRPLQLMMTMSLPAIDDEDGTALVCLVDISEIDRLNAELDRSLARLRQVNQELETFTYSVSHDLKAPLRGIDGYSRLLLTDHQAQLDEEGRRFLANIRQATQHMAVLIDDLLAYSRLERRDLILADLRLAPLVEGVLATYRQQGSAQGLELRVEMPADLHARADAQGLTIALRNLVDNALKFSRHTQAPRIRIVGSRSAGLVHLAVHDNGAGFDMRFHDRIFAIFQRLHRAEDYPGTGVGLAIVRKAMERMGGRVWGESHPGQGATFTLELPEVA